MLTRKIAVTFMTGDLADACGDINQVPKPRTKRLHRLFTTSQPIDEQVRSVDSQSDSCHYRKTRDD